MDIRRPNPIARVELSAFLPAELVNKESRIEAITRLADLPVPATQRYAALCIWEETVGLTCDRWEVELVLLGIYRSRRATP